MWTTVGIISFATYGLVRLAPEPIYYWRVRISFFPVRIISQENILFSELDCDFITLSTNEWTFSSSLDVIS